MSVRPPNSEDAVTRDQSSSAARSVARAGPRPIGRALRAARRPRVLISLTLSAGLLVALLSFGNIQDIRAEVSRFQLSDVVWFIGAFLLYELGRWLLWHFLVGSLGVQIRTRHQLVSFLMGEVSKNLPLGNYFPNYVLQRAEGTDFGLTSSITTTIVLLEVTVSLLGVVILGLPSWNSWLRPLILLGAPAFIVCSWAIYKRGKAVGAPHWMERSKLLRDLLAELKQFREGATRLWRPRTVALALVICAAYVTAAATALFGITQGLHVGALSWQQVLAVYCFSLAFALIEPSPVDLGVTEVGGVGAFLAVGLDKDPAITAMLINRVLTVGASLIIVGIGLVALRRDVRTVLDVSSTSGEGAQEDQRALRDGTTSTVSQISPVGLHEHDEE